MGIKWGVQKDESISAMPEEGYFAMTDISQWREVVQWPDLEAIDWDKVKADFMETYDPDKATIILLAAWSLFLIPIQMLGWTEGLCALLEEPEEFKAFGDALTDFQIDLLDHYCKYVIVPDEVLTGDDMSNANGPFFSREVWDEVFKDNFKRITDAIHSYGALAAFHNCGNNGYLVEAFLEIGADRLQCPMPTEELVEQYDRLGFSMEGGWECRGPGNVPGADEETVRESVRLAFDRFGRKGGYTFWDGGIAGSTEDAAKKREWVYDEMDKYGRAFYAELRKDNPDL